MNQETKVKIAIVLVISIFILTMAWLVLHSFVAYTVVRCGDVTYEGYMKFDDFIFTSLGIEGPTVYNTNFGMTKAVFERYCRFEVIGEFGFR